MISLSNISKSFGEQVLFDNISFKINSRERVGLVGRNGHGKTTLFRIITGEESPDAGTMTMPKDYRIGYVTQGLDFHENTVLKEGMRGLPEKDREDHWKVEKILAGLGFSAEEINTSPHQFSGGFQVRINLAKVLVAEPDLLLLDEPTNYLDITSIRWIERFLLNWRHELIIITHDRSFMDKVVTHVIGIHRKKTRKITGSTGKYYSQTAQDEEIYEQTRRNDEQRRKDIELFISRFRAKARLANLVQSRIKTLEKMEKRDKLEKMKTLDFSFRSSPFRGKFILQANNLSFSYNPKKVLINNFSVRVGKRDRIFVVGNNGKGKTTLLRLISETLKPQIGKIIGAPGIKKGFFEQTNIKNLDDTKTVEEEILDTDASVDRQKARNICGTMMFEGDNALKKIEVLSGGEKSRVMLGKLLLTPFNLLLLDEPTNHLDMVSCDALLAAIDSFDGAVIMVSHNEMFLHALAERLIVFQDKNPYVFEGSYPRFLEKVGWDDKETTSDDSSKSSSKANSSVKLTKKELRRKRSNIIAQRSRKLKPLEKKIAQVENNIETHEKNLEKFNKDLLDALDIKNSTRIVELSQAIHTSQAEIDDLFKELEKLMGSFEAQNKVFEQKLEQIGSENI